MLSLCSAPCLSFIFFSSSCSSEILFVRARKSHVSYYPTLEIWSYVSDQFGKIILCSCLRFFYPGFSHFLWKLPFANTERSSFISFLYFSLRHFTPFASTLSENFLGLCVILRNHTLQSTYWVEDFWGDRSLWIFCMNHTAEELQRAGGPHRMCLCCTPRLPLLLRFTRMALPFCA